MRGKVEINLKEHYFYETDYIQKVPNDFMKEWEDIGQKFERDDVYFFKMPSSDNSLLSINKIAQDLFDMHLCQVTTIHVSSFYLCAIFIVNFFFSQFFWQNICFFSNDVEQKYIL